MIFILKFWSFWILFFSIKWLKFKVPWWRYKNYPNTQSGRTKTIQTVADEGDTISEKKKSYANYVFIKINDSGGEIAGFLNKQMKYKRDKQSKTKKGRINTTYTKNVIIVWLFLVVDWFDSIFFMVIDWITRYFCGIFFFLFLFLFKSHYNKGSKSCFVVGRPNEIRYIQQRIENNPTHVRISMTNNNNNILL